MKNDEPTSYFRQVWLIITGLVAAYDGFVVEHVMEIVRLFAQQVSGGIIEKLADSW